MCELQLFNHVAITGCVYRALQTGAPYTEVKDLDIKRERGGGGKQIATSKCAWLHMLRLFLLLKARQRLHKMLEVDNRGNTPSKIPEGACVPFCPFGSYRLRKLGMSAGQHRASQAGRAGSMNG